MNRKYEKIELYILVISILLQNFAIIKTESFGISPLVLFCIYAFFRHNIYRQYLKKYMVIYSVVLVFINISFLLNNQYDIKKIVRFSMIVFIALTIYEYMKMIIKNNKWRSFAEILYNCSFFIGMYGLYQYIASKIGLPLFLNIFQNNPSYGARGIYEYYGGWVNTTRIYATFNEPSYYSIFLVIIIILIYMDKQIEKKKKYIFIIIEALNLALTFARSGWAMFIYILCLVMVMNYTFKFIRNKTQNILLNITLFTLPFINLGLMKLLDIFIFNDISSSVRTGSAIYYMQRSLLSIKNLLMGYGLGSMQREYTKELNLLGIEPFAHNGYIEIIYEFGLIFFIVLIICLFNFINKAKNIKVKILSTIVISSFFVFESYFNIESLISILVIFISVIMYLSEEDMNLDIPNIKLKNL